jgi:NCS1 family nucleobase:cation symporter-1
MIAAGGVWFGMFGLILLILANLTSSVVLMYSQAISVKTMLPKIRWHWCVLTVVPAAFLMLSPTFYDSYQQFLLYVAFIMATFGGVLVVDWLFIRHQRSDVGALYDFGNPQYRYWGGWNPTAVVSVALGSVFYWWMYNPVTDVSGPYFYFIGAGIPAFFVTGILYFVLAKTVFASVYRSERDWQRRVAAGETDAVALVPAAQAALSGAAVSTMGAGEDRDG